MTHYPFWPVTIAALVAFCAWVGGRLQRNAQPLRLELADKGEAVLTCEDTSETARHLVRSYLDSAFSSRGFLLLAILVIPGLAALKTYRAIRTGNANARPLREPNPEISKLVEEITDLHIRITAANHPFLFALVFILMAACFGVAHIVAAVVRGVIPEPVTAEEIVQRVDHAYARIPVRLRGTHRIRHICP